MTKTKNEYVPIKIKLDKHHDEVVGRTLVVDPDEKGVVRLLGSIGHQDKIIVTEELIEALKKALPPVEWLEQNKGEWARCLKQ